MKLLHCHLNDCPQTFVLCSVTECVDVPLQFKADSVGQFTCQVVMKSWMDTRLYLLEVLVSAQVGLI